GAGGDPGTQLAGALTQAVLDVAGGPAIARPDAVEPLDPALPEPPVQFFAVEVVVGGVAFAEQQPVAAMADGDPRLEQRAQAGQAGAVADQQQRAIVGRWMEAGVAAQAQ